MFSRSLWVPLTFSNSVFLYLCSSFAENRNHSGPENRQNQKEEESGGESTLTFSVLSGRFHASGSCMFLKVEFYFHLQEKTPEVDLAEGSSEKNPEKKKKKKKKKEEEEEEEEEEEDDEEQDVKPPDGEAADDDDEFDSGDEEVLTKSGESSRGFYSDI